MSDMPLRPPRTIPARLRFSGGRSDGGLGWPLSLIRERAKVLFDSEGTTSLLRGTVYPFEKFSVRVTGMVMVVVLRTRGDLSIRFLASWRISYSK